MHALRLLAGVTSVFALVPALALAQPPQGEPVMQPVPAGDPAAQQPPPPPPQQGAPPQYGAPGPQYGAPPPQGQPMPPPPVMEEEELLLAPNSVFVEGLGAGIYYSINYERMVVDQLGVRIGFSYLSLTATASSGGSTAESNSTYIGIPITASYVGLRGGSHALEIGGGATLIYTSASASGGIGGSASGEGFTAFGTAMLGYRIHPAGNAGFMFRVGAMALVGRGLSLSSPYDPDAIGVLPYLYISFGASF